ncbi:hypothetical protein KAT63_01795 [Candidatus Parcubacteria bacterium]|nr:hypothetical protein [Candidatus Parcubacteria bacterium]
MAKNDFDPDKLTTSLDKHGEDIINVKKRIEQLEDKFGNNEKIADTLCETAEKATKMREMISDTFLLLIEKDLKIKGGLKNLIKETDRDVFKHNINKLFSLIFALALIVFGALINKFI